MSKSDNIILITQGDPNGIGPEIILRGISSKYYPNLLVIGNVIVFRFYQKLLGSDIPINSIDKLENITNLDPNKLNILNLDYRHRVSPGIISRFAGELSIKCIDKAVDIIKMGLSNILITAPVNKKAIQKSVKTFIGHTEYLARAFNTNKVSMALISDKIKVATVTTHIPLDRVSGSINQTNIVSSLKNVDHFLKKIGITNGNIAVCALNPHSGDKGCFGNEENSIIIPAIEEAKRFGINAFGPYPADSIFCSAYNNTYDFYIAMYHDQGLIPFKLLSFNSGINITLGLPFLRVSVEHGTAFDIAGKGKANLNSIKETIRWTFI